jgi:hypothetical protein
MGTVSLSIELLFFMLTLKIKKENRPHRKEVNRFMKKGDRQGRQKRGQATF